MPRVTLLLAACSLVACADDKDPTTSPETLSSTIASQGSNPGSNTQVTQDPSEADTSGLTEDNTSTPDPTVGPTSGPTSGPTTNGPDSTTGNPLDSCALHDPPDACDDCTCYTCLDEYAYCLETPGCKEMDDCFRLTGCVMEDCYAVCAAEIDAYGGDPYAGAGYVNLSGCRNGPDDCDLHTCGGFDPF